MDRTIWTFVVLNTIGGLGHHVDHTLRHKVGWPLTHDVNGYTITWLIYVVILIGAILTRRGVAGPFFWGFISAGGFVYTLVIHFAVNIDPPAQYAAQYGSSVKGAIAVTWLVLFLISLASTAVYAFRRWAVLRQQRLVSATA